MELSEKSINLPVIIFNYDLDADVNGTDLRFDRDLVVKATLICSERFYMK